MFSLLEPDPDGGAEAGEADYDDGDDYSDLGPDGDVHKGVGFAGGAGFDGFGGGIFGYLWGGESEGGEGEEKES